MMHFFMVCFPAWRVYVEQRGTRKQESVTFGNAAAIASVRALFFCC